MEIYHFFYIVEVLNLRLEDGELRMKNLIVFHNTYASEPQRRVRDFCLSLSELSELRRALNFPCRADQL